MKINNNNKSKNKYETHRTV